MVTTASIRLTRPDAIRAAANGDSVDDISPTEFYVDRGHPDDEYWDDEYRRLLDQDDGWSE